MSTLKKEIRTWAKRIGERNAVGKLVALGVSTRAAERLCAGDYPSEPKAIKSKLIEALASDAISQTA